ncbi:MAG: copper homeostasis membrane protein CopD [Alcaligenaceae bacterium]|nr:copper homeostasis membrane protein CopD [Alcaligenaceae bacterium SAGV5]MPS53384.1 copper homeostasis membrane protein CopD [Alcaligenaceae bacterium SAGV3]MPT56408.1 copper homeostasis membrane protein CopD [Alcaligenaceae bacterium]
MSEGLGVAVRFALYVDLALLGGVPLFILHSFRREWEDGEKSLRFGALLVTAAAIGIPLAGLGLALLAQSMSGAEHLMDLRPSILAMVVGGTDAGLAAAIRIVALMLALACAVSMKYRCVSGLWAVAGSALVALASLAWGGHGAMDDGARGYLHLAADIVHLIAAAGWVGALTVFAAMLWLRPDGAPDRQVRLLSRGLTGFAGLGTVTVAALAFTGAANYWFIVGPTVQGLLSGLYGWLLVGKLGLFVLMLGLAAANRFRLGPMLEASIAGGRPEAALVLLRKSLALEAGAATAILLLVAWLGTLGPPA